jgi:hypothetical protein
MYNGDQWYYLLHQQGIYLSYEDFRQQLPVANYQFLSNSNKQLPPLVRDTASSTTDGISMTTTTDPEKLQQKIIATQGHQFIISASKQASQALFKKLLAA